jgi:MerR family transcriptional regulator, redox-sensitive transcriptional activator SoxR
LIVYSMAADALLTVGELAARAGVAASALRFYEAEGLLVSLRSSGGQRRFRKDVLRRVAFIRAAQTVGLTINDIRTALAKLPDARTPNKADWARLSSAWQPLLDAKISALTALRSQLTQCIGCGCLSLKVCALYNPGDAVSANGSGARFLLGDKSQAQIKFHVRAKSR